MAQRSDTTELPNKPGLEQVRVVVLFGGSHLFGQERANLEVMRTLRDVGYQYGIQPDHTLRQPEPADPGAGQQYTAFVFGYIKALIAAVNSEA